MILHNVGREFRNAFREVGRLASAAPPGGTLAQGTSLLPSAPQRKYLPRTSRRLDRENRRCDGLRQNERQAGLTTKQDDGLRKKIDMAHQEEKPLNNQIPSSTKTSLFRSLRAMDEMRGENPLSRQVAGAYLPFQMILRFGLSVSMTL